MLKQFPPQTSFNLNGPHLSFIQNPVGITTENGYPVTLVGIATASFKTGVSTDSPSAPDNPAVSTGSLSYQWYEVGINGAADKKVVDDVDTNNGVITGSGTTTLTIRSVVTPQDDGKQYYLTADYVPSTTTGEAHNEPLKSGIGTVTVLSVLEITKQPESASSFNSILSYEAIQEPAKFNVGARVSGKNEGEDVTYQWYFDSGTDSYATKPLYRHYNPNSTDHYCSDNPVPATGYHSQGVICQIFIHQAPGTIAIIDAEPDSPTVDRPDTGIIGYAYPSLKVALDEGQTEGSVTAVYNMQKRDLVTQGADNFDTGTDEMWSTSPNEGVIAVWGQMTITPDVVTEDLPTYTWDTSTEEVIKTYNPQGGGGYFRPTVGYPAQGVTYTLKANTNITVDIEAKGAAGGYSPRSRTDGGSGGHSEGKFTFIKNQEYLLRIGGKGEFGKLDDGIIGSSENQGGWNGGGNGKGYDRSGGGGGGYTGLFLKSGSLDLWTTTLGVPDTPLASWYGVAYGDPSASVAKFVAVGPGVNGAMYSRDNGITWEGASPAEATEWRSVTWGDDKFVAVAQSGTNRVMYSNDGITWISATAPTDTWQSVTYGNGKYVAVANSSGGTHRAMYSTDGINWNNTTTNTSTFGVYWTSVTYGNGRFVAVGYVGSGSTPKSMRSVDGLTWAEEVLPYGADDPREWMSVTYGVDNNGIGKFVAGATDGTKRLMYSYDGSGWTLVESPSGTTSNGWHSMAYGEGRFVAVSSTFDTSNRIIYSNDGITWIKANAVEDPDDDWKSVTYGDGRFVAVSSEYRSDGRGTYVTYSSYTGDGNIRQSNAIIIAAGGGGAANDGMGASAGGGLEGQTLTAAWNRRGGPGTQNNGGEGGGNSQAASAANGPGLTVGEAGSALQGGKGAGGGGGGYYGGGGGVTNTGPGSDGDGGGGSSYLHPDLLTDAITVTAGGGKGNYSDSGQDNADGEFRMEATNYASGSSYHGTWFDGTINDVFDGSTLTNLHGRPSSFSIRFTNLPVPTTSLRFYIVQQSGKCVLETGKYGVEESITCGEFDTRSTAGGLEGNFLGGDDGVCRNGYVRPTGQLDSQGYQMRFNAEVPLKVSAGDLVSILCVLDNPNSPTVYIDLLVQYGGQSKPTVVPFGIAPKYANWNACQNGSWVSATLIDSGVLVGLIARGGYSYDALGLAQMRINGTTIYKGQTYTTKSTVNTSTIAEGSVGINWPAAGSGRTRNEANGEWVTVDSSVWTSQEILSLSWNGGGAGDGCGLYAIEIDGSILGDSGGYVNTGIKFYAPNEAFTIPTSSLLLNDGDLVNKSTTWEFTGAPDEYASYIVSAIPLNSQLQFENQAAVISGGAQNPTKNIVGNTVSSGYGTPIPFTIVTSETMGALENGVGAKFYGSCARKPLKVESSSNTSFIRITLGEGAQFGSGAYTMEWWQFVDKQDFGDPQTWGVDFNYPPARDSYSDAGVTPFIRIENSSNYAQNSRIVYYKWNAQHRRAADVLGYGGYLTYSQWQHIAITRDDNSRVRIFIDGKLTNSFSDNTNYQGIRFYCITGIHPYTDGYYVQDHRIYSGVAKYTENFTPPSQMMIYAIKEKKTFTDDGSFLLPSNATNVKLEVAGAKGGDGGSDRDGVGGIGGKGRQGTFLLDSAEAAGEEFVIKVGNAGNDGPSCNGQGGSGGDGGGGNGGDAIGCSGFGGGGGGATSVGLVKWNNGFIVAGGGGGAGGGSWERSGDNGADCGAFSASNSSNIAIDPGSIGSDAERNGSGGGGGGAGVSGGVGGRGGVDKSHGGGGGLGGTSQYYSVSTTYDLVVMYRDYGGAPLHDHICNTDPEPAAGFARDGILCRIYKNQAPHTVAIIDNDEPERYDGPIMGYAYPNLQAVYDAGLNQGNVRPIYRLEGSNAYGWYDIMWSIHTTEGAGWKNTGVKFYAPWSPITVTGQVGGDTFSVLESETLNDGDGFVHLSYDHTSESEPFISIESSDILNITGSKTPELTLRSNYAADENVYCQVSSPLATNSPLDTNKVTYVNKVVEGFITINSIGGGIIQSSNINLANGDYTIGNLSSDTDKQQVVNYVSFYSSLDDVEIEMDMYGGMGEDGVNSLGGEGGFSRIQFKLERNVEYVIAGLTDDVRAPFLYRGANLMAVVGGGGQGGYESKTGGDGGGVGVRGGNGTKGNDYGAGGDYIQDGNLDVNGTFGSSYFVDPSSLQPGDVSNNAFDLMDTWQNAAGRTIKCTKGPYWISRGYGPCQDMGKVRFIDENGVEPPTNNTNSITRGFKAGYNIMKTGALGRVPSNIKQLWAQYNAGRQDLQVAPMDYRSNISVSGSGGNGVAGGKGATQNGGGGGGSGYQDGSVTVIHTQQGGSEGKAKVVMRLKKNSLGRIGTIIPASNNPLASLHKDDQGRILILSALTTGTSYPNQPNYLQARGGSPPPMPGTNSCVTDEKWQYILDLARDGTQDWRLAVCAPDGSFSANNRRKIAGANPRNIWRMMNANRIPLRNSLAHGWVSPYNWKPGWALSYPTQLTLAWDETSGYGISGVDYSLLWWVPGRGWGYYGHSSNPFFSPTVYYQKSAEWWILPPGVPDF